MGVYRRQDGWSTAYIPALGRLRCSVAEKSLSVFAVSALTRQEYSTVNARPTQTLLDPKVNSDLEPPLHRVPLCVPLMASPSSLVNATNGTTLLYTFERATLMDPSAPCCFTTFKITC